MGLIQSNWCPYKKKFRHTDIRDACAQSKDHVNTQREGDHLSKSQGERLQKKPYSRTTWSWTSSLQICEKINVSCETTQPVVFCYGSPTKLIQLGKSRARNSPPGYLPPWPMFAQPISCLKVRAKRMGKDQSPEPPSVLSPGQAYVSTSGQPAVLK